MQLLPENKAVRRILFVVPQLTQGGSNRSLEALLSLWQPSGVDMYVVALSNYSHGDIYYESFASRLIPLSWLWQLCNRVTAFRKGLNAMKNFLALDLWSLLYRHEALRLQRRYDFDIVVGYEESYATHFASHFPTRRLAWVHCDYRAYSVASNGLDEQTMYSCFDKIVCVSCFAARIFTCAYPMLYDRVVVQYNLIDFDRIIRMGNEAIDDAAYRTDVFTIVSVGRFVDVKQFHIVPKVVNEILREHPGLRFRWYILGDGSSALMDYTRQQISAFNLEDYVYLLGEKRNPYPYIKQSNLLVCMSTTESWSYVINEAKVLHTPVVTLRSGASDEVLASDEGWITDSTALPDVIASLIVDDSGVYTDQVRKIAKYVGSNSKDICRLPMLLGVEDVEPMADFTKPEMNIMRGVRTDGAEPPVSFSIIMPLYNKEKAILETLQSVLQQTYPSFELIVVDDGSKDKSAEIVKSIDDGRIRYFYKENGGVSSARNFGIARASHEWFLMLDADDELEPDALATFVRLMMLYPSYNVFQGNMWLCGCLRCKTMSTFARVSTNPFRDWWGMKLAPEMGTFVVRRSVAIAIGPFNELISCFEDLEYTSRLMEREAFVYTSKAVKVYREQFSTLSVVAQPIEREFAYHMTESTTSGSFWKQMVLAYNVWDTRRHRRIHRDSNGVRLYTSKLRHLFPWYVSLYFFLYKDVRQWFGDTSRRMRNKCGGRKRSNSHL